MTVTDVEQSPVARTRQAAAAPQARSHAGGRLAVSRFRTLGASPRSRRGFTLVEVLATLLLIGIVLPTVMHGVTVSGDASSYARRNSEAAGLAEQKLGELVATGDWLSGGNSTGDFAPEWPGYRYEWALSPYVDNTTTSDSGVQQLDLRVIWLSHGMEDSLLVSTLVYDKQSAASSSSASSTTTP